MRARFDGAFEEVMFSAAVWSSNQDPLRPKVTCITRLAHEVDGRRIPGTRWGIDNPDSVYRVIPISGDERYEIRGRVGAHRMTENYFTLWDAQHGHRRRARRHDLDARRGRRLVRDHRRRRPGRTAGPTTCSRRRRRTSSTSATCCSTGAATTPTRFTVERLGGAADDAGAHRSTSRPRRPPRIMAHFAELHRQAQPRHVQVAGEPLLARLDRPTTPARCATRCTSPASSCSRRTRRSWST